MWCKSELLQNQLELWWKFGALLQRTGKAVLALQRMTNLSNRSDGSDSPTSTLNGKTNKGNAFSITLVPGIFITNTHTTLVPSGSFLFQTRLWRRRLKMPWWLWSSSWGVSRISHKPFMTLQSPAVLLCTWPALYKVTSDDSLPDLKEF